MTACLRFVVAAIEQLLDKRVDAIPVKDERSKDYQGGENPCQRVSSRPG